MLQTFTFKPDYVVAHGNTDMGDLKNTLQYPLRITTRDRDTYEIEIRNENLLSAD